MVELSLGGPSPQDPEITRIALIAVRGGDESAFRQLWERVHPAIEVHLLGRVRGSIDATLRQHLDADLDDILQDVGVTVFRRVRDFEYRGPGSLVAWSIQVCNFVVKDWIDHWRSGKRNPRREVRISSVAGADTSMTHDLQKFIRDTATGPATSADRRETSRRVAEALETLDEREHQIVMLRYFGGAEWNEVASSVGATSGDAVRMKCFKKIIPKLAVRLGSP